MRVFVAEKPSLGLAIAEGIGITKKGRGFYECVGGVIVTWCIGHLLENFSPSDYSEKYKVWEASDLPIVPDQWKLKVKPETNSQFKTVKEWISKASEIVNAGDPDREGALLVDEVIHFCGKKADLRILLSDMNIKAVKRALKKLQPNSITENLSTAGLCRSKADWLVGMNLTRAFTLAAKKTGMDTVLSIGRVQTPVLGLIVARDLSIEKFVSHPFYGLEGEFKASAGVFKASWQMIAAESYVDEAGRVTDKGYIESVKDSMHGKPAEIIKLDKIMVTSNPPLLFSLSGLQKAAIKQFGMTSDQVVSAAQSLYEIHKLTTYPRSSSNHLPLEHFEDAEHITNNMVASKDSLAPHIENANFDKPSPSFKDIKGEAHHAIIPTGEWKNQALNKNEERVYGLICRQYLAQFMGDKLTAKTEVIVELAGSKNYRFKATGGTMEKAGYSVLFKTPTDKLLPIMSEGEAVKVNCLELLTKNTTPPKHFTEDTLLDAMTGIGKHCQDQTIIKHLKDTDGLGTEATRSKYVELLIKREFIIRNKTQLLSTTHGRGFIECLPEQLTLPDSTALWESKLNLIANKELKPSLFLDEIKSSISALCEVASKTQFTDSREKFNCPKCNENIFRIKKKKGGFFWGCSNRGNCDYTVDDKKGIPDFNKKEYPCPDCSKPLVRRKGQSGDFWGCSGFKDGCRFSAPNKSNRPDFEAANKKQVDIEKASCPICENEIKRLYSKKNESFFWVHCEESKDCKKYISDDNGKPKK